MNKTMRRCLLTVIIIPILIVNVFPEETKTEMIDSQFSDVVKFVHEGDLKNIKKRRTLSKEVNKHYIYQTSGHNRSETLLKIACREGYFEIVKYLIKCGADIYDKNPVEDAIDSNNYSIAEYIVKKLRKDIKDKLLLKIIDNNSNIRYVNLLLDNGANPNFVDHGFTALSASPNVQICDLLIKYGGLVNPPLNDELQYSPLHMAIKFGRYDVADLLICKGADINLKDTRNGCTPLILAIRGESIDDNRFRAGDHISYALSLINKGVKVNIKNNGGFEAIHYTCSFARMRNDIGIRNYHNILFGEKASRVREPVMDLYVLLINELIKKGAKIDSVSDGGLQPIHFAAFSGSYYFVSLLLNSGINANAMTYWKNITPLWCCIGGINRVSTYNSDNIGSIVTPEMIKILKLLIQKGADVNSVSEIYAGSSPLHLAISYNDSELADLFIRAGANINCKNNQGDTPLHVAVKESHPYMVKYLLYTGANKGIKNKEGKTPYDVARETNVDEIQKLLK